MKIPIFSLVLFAALAFAQAPAQSPIPPAGTNGAGSADLKSWALRNEIALELQLIESQQKEAVAPYQAIIEQLKAAADKLNAMLSAQTSPLAARHNELVLEACKSAGLNEADVKAQKCQVDIKAKTVSRAPDAPVNPTPEPSKLPGPGAAKK